MFQLNISEETAFTLLELVSLELEKAQVNLAKSQASDDVLGALIDEDRVNQLTELLTELSPIADLFEE